MRKQVWDYDRLPKVKGRLVLGVDEVGVGALAGPIVACATVIRAGTDIMGMRDSKKMSESLREACVPKIQQAALCHFTSWADPDVVDNLGMHQARLQVMAHCVRQVALQLQTRTTEVPLIVVDGDKRLNIDMVHTPLVGGDSRSLAVAGAAVIAKVTRDRHMRKLHKDAPLYDWAANKGYGTPKHLAALLRIGISPHHRTKLARRTLRRYRAKQESGS